MLLDVKGSGNCGIEKPQHSMLGAIKAMVDLLITLGNLSQTLLSVYALILLVHMYLLH